jgi:predicted RND superfamily exporter protein
MPLFGLFLMALILALYRSWRTLAAIVVTLAAVVAMAMGLAALFGWAHTVVSALVPLTVLVTTTATLVYLHSRYIERDDSPTLAEHHARALANKLLPCTASMLATAIGFAALAVSDIRPIREMGLWTAGGLAVAWAGCFLLFPAMQSMLNTPLKGERAPAGRWYPRFVDHWIPLTRRYRWPLIIATLLLTACGAVALFGVRGFVAPLALQTDALSYIDPDVPIAKDTREFEKHSGLTVLELWLRLPPGETLSPALTGALRDLARALERDPRITAVEGPGAIMGRAGSVPSSHDPAAQAAASTAAGSASTPSDASAHRFVVVTSVTNVRLSVRGRDTAFGPPGAMRDYIERTFRAAQAAEPALRGARGQVVGRSVVAEQISLELVPTLVQSFGLTAGVIFCVFLLVFRSASARLMAMIPSLFAILAAFLVMRASGMTLNIATILIGSTVLGATENDQVHFFYHFQEARAARRRSRGRRAATGSDEAVSAVEETAAALRHAFRVAGRPIAFATLVNAAGFLALALSDLPPMREFGIVSASAFLLALAADFTALPAALWILDRSHRVSRAVRAQLAGGQPDG